MVAIFIALGGTAAANHPGGADTISSDDIINGAVKSADVGNNTLESADVRDETSPGGGLQAIDLRPDSVGASEVIAESLTGAEIGDESLTGADVGDGSLGGGEISEGSIGTLQIGDGTLTAQDVEPNALGTAAVDETDLFNDDSLTATDLATASVAKDEIADNAVGTAETTPTANDEIVDSSVDSQDVRNNSLTGDDIDESTLSGTRASRLNDSGDGTRALVKSYRIAVDATSPEFRVDPMSFHFRCPAGEATVDIENNTSSTTFYFLDRGSSTPAYQQIGSFGGPVGEGSATASDLWVVHYGTVATTSSPQASDQQGTALIGIDESLDTACRFYVRTFVTTDFFVG